jgi:hypothetical protein
MKGGELVTDTVDDDSLSNELQDENGNPDPTKQFEFIAVNDEYAK